MYIVILHIKLYNSNALKQYLIVCLWDFGYKGVAYLPQVRFFAHTLSGVTGAGEHTLVHHMQ